MKAVACCCSAGAWTLCVEWLRWSIGRGRGSGVSVAHDRRTTGTVVDDQTIELKVYDALNQQLPPGNRISMSPVTTASVLLTGEVVSERHVQQANMIARGISIRRRCGRCYNELVGWTAQPAVQPQQRRLC
jgi:osmotically-inducible protein OsmY